MKTVVFKIILISEVILLMNFFCSCNSKDKIQLEKEKTEEVAISIINMIENNNREELKNRFTDKAIQTQDFDLGLEYIFNCYSGKCENIIDSGTHIRDLFDNGKQTKTALAYFDITTADSEFLLYFEYCSIYSTWIPEYCFLFFQLYFVCCSKYFLTVFSMHSAM